MGSSTFIAQELPHYFKNSKENNMKFFTLTLVTICLLAVCTVSVAQTSFISLKSIETNKANMVSTAGSINFNPTGIAKGIIKVKMFNQPDGIYTVQLIDVDGKVLGTKQIHHTDGTTQEIADFGKNFAGGTYQVEMVNPDNQKIDQTIMLLI
jgi:hypothetical protein